jgi:hypothetical protein
MRRPQYGTHGLEVLQVLDGFGGATGHEITELTGLRSPTAHLSRLSRHDLVYVTRESRRNGSGRKARVWDLTRHGLQVLEVLERKEAGS